MPRLNTKQTEKEQVKILIKRYKQARSVKKLSPQHDDLTETVALPTELVRSANIVARICIKPSTQNTS